MSLADLMKEKIEKQLDSWGADLEAAESKAKAKEAKAEKDAADAQFEKELLGKIGDLKDKISEGRAYLEELLGGDDDTAEKVKSKYDKLSK